MALDKAATVAHYMRLAEEAAKYRAEQSGAKGSWPLAVLSTDKDGGGAAVGVSGVNWEGKDQRCIHCRRMGNG
jgi:hypothetical protein